MPAHMSEKDDRDRYVMALVHCQDCSGRFKVPTAVLSDVVVCPFCCGESVAHSGPFDE
jgi:hypothetical protein